MDKRTNAVDLRFYHWQPCIIVMAHSNDGLSLAHQIRLFEILFVLEHVETQNRVSLGSCPIDIVVKRIHLAATSSPSSRKVSFSPTPFRFLQNPRHVVESGFGGTLDW